MNELTRTRIQTLSLRATGFRARELAMLAALMGPSAITLLDSGMLSVALPRIQAEFAAPVDRLAWTVAGSAVSMVTLMPLFGGVGDLLGKKRLYLAGLLIFALGAALSMTAPSLLWLVVGRLLQGAGSAAMPLAIALIVEAFPGERRGRALGLWNSAAPAGIVLGPPLGGLVVQALGWRAVFALGVLGSLAALPGIVWMAPEPRRSAGPRPFDWAGALILTALIAGLLLATTAGGLIAPGSSLNLAFWALAAAALPALVWNARRQPAPIVSGEMLRNRRFLAPSLAVSLRMFAHDGMRFLIVLYLANTFGHTPTAVGAFILFYNLPLLIGVAWGGALSDRWRSRTVGTLGMLGLAAGLLGLALPPGPDRGAWLLAPAMLLGGLAGGVCLIPFTREAVEAPGEGRAGLASGLYNTIRFIGSAAATPLLGLLLAGGFARHGGLQSVAGPYRQGFVLLGAVAALGALAAAFIPPDSRLPLTGKQ